MNRSLLINSKSFPNNFDVIRFVLAASVLLCHSYAVFNGNAKFSVTEPFMVWSGRQISIGSVAVNLFFVISGFLVVKSFQSSSGTFEYLSKRVLRIYPGFIVAYLVSLLLAGFLGSGLISNWNGYTQYLQMLNLRREMLHLVGLQAPYHYNIFKGLPQQGINESLWTIQFEFVCYLLVLFFAGIGFFSKKWRFIAGFFLMYIVFFVQYNGYIRYREFPNLLFGNPYHHPRFITYFLAGACFYYYRNIVVRSRVLAVLAMIALVSSFLWIRYFELILPVAGTYLLFYVAFHPAVKCGGFAKFGDFSYGMYLYGWPVQQMIMYFFRDHVVGPFNLFIITLCVTLVVAFCSWHLVENPFLKLKEKRKKKFESIATV
ncbi:MAG: acyltransferase [Ferruginibacter sp.]|nr:acyltransferase [Ferruginibacter sp.]